MSIFKGKDKLNDLVVRQAQTQDPKTFFAQLAKDLKEKAEDAAKTAGGKYSWQWGPGPVTKGTR